jgi:DNA-binding MarR family transcriptional regulator
LLELLRTADVIWNASRVLFERWRLGPSQFNVLNLLHLKPAGLSQSELSRHLIMHRSNLTWLVDRLEKEGLVCRKESVVDRRAYRVMLTPAGAALLETILPSYYGEAEKVWRHLGLKRAAQLILELQAAARNPKELSIQLPK